jgi:hypothetical protein
MLFIKIETSYNKKALERLFMEINARVTPRILPDFRGESPFSLGAAVK